MQRRRSFWKPLVLSAAGALFLTLGVFPTPSRSAVTYQGETVMESLAEAYAIVETNYAGNIDYEQTVSASIDGMLHVLDPHSNYYTKEEFLEMRSQQQSEYFGIGATVIQYQGKVYIRSPFENAPATRAGLRYGDMIVSINGQSAEGWNSSKVSQELKGPRGTQVTVGVSRAGEPKPLEFTISRDAVSLPSITNSYIIKPGVGYIALRRQFTRTSGEEMVAAVSKLKKQGMNRLLFDLRENPGGLVQSALEICDMFLARGQNILTIKSRKGTSNERSFESRNATPETIPMVTLVNGNSASASEIVAGALQDHDRSAIVGEVTFGKGLVQTIYPISNGTGLTLTTAKYYTPSGRLIQRDYSSGSRYNYYYKRDETTNGEKDGRPEFHTDGGQTVFGGGGITPNVLAKPGRLTNLQARLQEPIFLFVRELVNGKVEGLADYRTPDLNFNHTLTPNEFLVNDKVIEAFKNFLARTEKDFRISPNVVNDNLNYLKLYIRFDILTSAYGAEVAQQVLIDDDPQVKRSLEELEKAKEFSPKPR